MSEKHSTARVKRPSLRQLEREIKTREFFHWHCQQQYVECVVNGRSGFRLTSKYSASVNRKGGRADSLNHSRGPAACSIWARVEKIRQPEVRA